MCVGNVMINDSINNQVSIHSLLYRFSRIEQVVMKANLYSSELYLTWAETDSI